MHTVYGINVQGLSAPVQTAGALLCGLYCIVSEIHATTKASDCCQRPICISCMLMALQRHDGGMTVA